MDYEKLAERQGEVIKILSALQAVEESIEWSTLRELVFDKRVANLRGQLLQEAQKDDVNLPNLYRLQGRLLESRRLASLSETLKLELTNIKRNLTSPPTERQ